MDKRESTGRTPSHDTPRATSAASDVPAVPSEGGEARVGSNEDLLSGTGAVTPAASPAEPVTRPAPGRDPSGDADLGTSTQAAPRYVRRHSPHRSQGTVDDLNDQSLPSVSYTHDSNISVGGSTPLSGMAYRRARSNMSRVTNSRYGQYLEIPKGRRSIFASRERARRRRSVLSLLAVVALLVLAAMFLWGMMQNLLG
ncbi:MAG: hypothetical protein QM302_02565 [Acidobacteriota bacterium]|nr:hypothetical protein [Acidobacteriota bacterium]